ncbi:MAG: DNA recombination protein RmuC [Bacteroidales bacterium]|nr:DNA recombination protein RmuC [Bacteroidales bacterium]
MNSIIAIIIAVLVTAAVTWAISHLAAKASYGKIIAGKDAALLESEAARTREAALHQQENKLHEQENELHRQALASLKESQEKALEAVKNELALENEKMLKERQAALKAEAEETMKNITGSLGKDIRDMKDAFDAQKKLSAEESSAIKTKFEETVRNLKYQTDASGTQASDLANALKGKNKMQGIFGETILENILQGEGLRKGHDYDSEFWLRDKAGNIIRNEETGRRMRPDFALHFPDNTDVLLDSKMSLTALADYFSATSDEQRSDASRRNLQSVTYHIKELTDKEYQKFVSSRKTLDYVIMFIPNYGAYQLAKQEDPDIFSKAFAQNVLITTEETLVPFLRLIRSAWVQKEQMENMADIVSGAQKMLDRVAIFCEKNNELEKQLRKTLELCEDNTSRLVDGRQSIVKAAREVAACGISLSPGKTLPELS